MIEASRRRRRIQILVVCFVAVTLGLTLPGLLRQGGEPRSRIGSEVGPRRNQGGLGQVVNDAIAGIDLEANAEGEALGQSQGSGAVQPSGDEADDGRAEPSTADAEAAGPEVGRDEAGTDDANADSSDDPDEPTSSVSTEDRVAASTTATGPGPATGPDTTTGSDGRADTSGFTSATTRSPTTNASATPNTRLSTTTRPSVASSSTTRLTSTTIPTTATSTTLAPTTGTSTTLAPTTGTSTTTTELPPIDAICALDISVRSKLRAEPRNSADEIGSVDPGVYTVLARSGNWYQVSDAQATGWVTEHPRRQPVGSCD